MEGASLAVGMVLYPSLGGSSAVAVELAQALARRGHRVHLVSTDVPYAMARVRPADAARLVYHRVEVPTYPLFVHAPYDLAMAAKLAEVAAAERLDVLHVHYAVPHVLSAVVARDMMPADARPAVVVTLHGTDVTLTGADPLLRPAVAHALSRADALTAVSAYLAGLAAQTFAVPAPEAIPDFVDHRAVGPAVRERERRALAPGGEAVVLHASNFRPVKQVGDVVAVFARLAATVPAVLVLCGDGPEAATALARARDLGVIDRVRFLGARGDLAPIMAASDLFLLPTAGEGFGLAALEAMVQGVPVIGTRLGGLPEVVEDGASGYLLPLHDVDGMAEAALRTLEPARHAVMSAAARARAGAFTPGRIVPRYEAVYRRAGAQARP